MGFFKAASALLCSALPQRIQNENLAAGTDNLKYKTVFQICCVNRGGKKEYGKVEFGQKN